MYERSRRSAKSCPRLRGGGNLDPAVTLHTLGVATLTLLFVAGILRLLVTALRDERARLSAERQAAGLPPLDPGAAEQDRKYLWLAAICMFLAVQALPVDLRRVVLSLCLVALPVGVAIRTFRTRQRVARSGHVAPGGDRGETANTRLRTASADAAALAAFFAVIWIASVGNAEVQAFVTDVGAVALAGAAAYGVLVAGHPRYRQHPEP